MALPSGGPIAVILPRRGSDAAVPLWRVTGHAKMGTDLIEGPRRFLDLRRRTMRPNGSRGDGPARRRAWTSPTVTAVAVRAETKSAAVANVPEPQPPAAPASKLGFSFEMAFPLSARVQ